MIILDTLFTFFITVSFAILFNVRGKLIVYSAIGGCISIVFYWITMELGYTYPVAYFIGTAATALYSEVMSRPLKTTVPTLLVAALIRLAPGGGVYYTMFYLIKSDYTNAVLKGTETFITAGAMALGIIIVSTFSMVIKSTKI